MEDFENELSIGSFRKTPPSRRSWQNTCLGSEGLTQKGAAWFRPGNDPRLGKTEILEKSCDDALSCSTLSSATNPILCCYKAFGKIIIK